MQDDFVKFDMDSITDNLTRALPVIDPSPMQEVFAALDRTKKEQLEREMRQLHAAEETAANTQDLKNRLEKIIDNQNEYIYLLREQVTEQRQQNKTLQHQLQVIRNLFASQEDGVAVEKEIMRLIQEQIDEKHPLWEYVKDKGGDLAVNAMPVIFTAMKTYFATHGVLLP